MSCNIQDRQKESVAFPAKQNNTVCIYSSPNHPNQTSLTLGQYTAAEPHGSCVDDAEPAGQKYPALQLPTHDGDVSRSVFP